MQDKGPYLSQVRAGAEATAGMLHLRSGHGSVEPDGVPHIEEDSFSSDMYADRGHTCYSDCNVEMAQFYL